MAKFWRIRSGAISGTGVWLPNRYTVDLYGTAAVSCRTLADAKRIAVEHGASGKWTRRKVKDGWRSRTEYVDKLVDATTGGA